MFYIFSGVHKPKNHQVHYSWIIRLISLCWIFRKTDFVDRHQEIFWSPAKVYIVEIFWYYSSAIVNVQGKMKKAELLSVLLPLFIRGKLGTNKIDCDDELFLRNGWPTKRVLRLISSRDYSGTSLKRTSSKADTSPRRTKNFVPDEFLRNPL